MIKNLGEEWNIKSNEDIPNKFFKDNMKIFKNYAGDMETLLFNVKLEHSKRMFCNKDSLSDKKIINSIDLINGYE